MREDTTSTCLLLSSAASEVFVHEIKASSTKPSASCIRTYIRRWLSTYVGGDVDRADGNAELLSTYFDTILECLESRA